MAVYRKPPKCPICGEPINGKYRDDSHLPLIQQPLGDNFIGWDFVGHKCKEQIKKNMKKVYCIDIDGVICHEQEGHCYDRRVPIMDNIKKINELYETDIVILYTSRDIVDKYVTEQWMIKHGVSYHDIIFNKPKYDVLWDDKAVNTLVEIQDDPQMSERYVHKDKNS